MNRKIKFRCWDKENKEFIDPYEFSVRGNGDILFSFMQSSKNMCLASKVNLEDNFILTQSTGLLDSNGNEIYEGDILENIDGSIIQVKFQIKRIVPSDVITGSPVILFNEWFIGFSLNLFGTPKIIGNIFESTELLENKE